ncbi:MAG TPA: S9 family peptidase [Albitalea sp.]|nr:S9 family peptidase [Albitalea sp.]
MNNGPRIVAPYGTWKSPISAQRLASGSKPLTAPRIVGGQIYWLEGLVAEGGRVVVMRAQPGGSAQQLTPPGFNVRTRVHEYGGGPYATDGETIWFSNFYDHLVYAQRGSAAPEALTHDSRQRHADFELDTRRARLIAVREDHGQDDHEPHNSLVAIGFDGKPSVLVEGADFYMAPRLSPDGRQLAWLSWNHPLMPWNGTELWLADVAADGSLQRARRIAGSDHESLCQPAWSPEGVLCVVSDRSGWWNLYRVERDTLHPVGAMQAEFGQPQWVFAQALYGFSSIEVVAACIDQGVSKLLRGDLRGGHWQPIASAYTDVRELRAGPGFVVVLAGSPTTPEQLLRIDLATGHHQVLAQSAADLPDAGTLSAPRSIGYPSSGGRVAHAFHYAPRNAAHEAPAGELPPLIVTSHGGPTSMSTSSLRLAIQYWTSRGFAVLDVNYGGSTGYGRAYMDSLKGQWGIVDVDDCVAGARYLAQQGLVDPQRMAIRGASASGFTTLCALTFHDVFKAGASYYGVSDLKGLDDDTHKFESRYTEYLVGPPSERERLYAQRSPVLHTAELACPMIFFQGLDDKVVPPAQSQTMVDALASRGIPVAYLTFEGEGHGFRRLETIRRTLEAELLFYAHVFGFTPADALEPIEIRNARGGA